MKIIKENLGKVGITIDKDYWNPNKCYDRLVIVQESSTTYRSFISKKAVPEGISLDNTKYWMPFSNLQEDYVDWSNNLQRLINDYSKNAENAMSFVGNKETLASGVQTTITFTLTFAQTVETNVKIVWYKNSVKQPQDIIVPKSQFDTYGKFEFSDTIFSETLYKFDVLVNDVHYFALWKVKAVYDYYVGVGTEYTDILTNEYKHVGAASMAGNYYLSPSDDDHLFIVCRDIIVPANVKQNGNDVPIDFIGNIELNNIDYSIYRSRQDYDAGHIMITIYDLIYDRESYIQHLIEEVEKFREQSDETEEKVENIADEETITVNNNSKVALKNRPIKKNESTGEVIQRGYVILKETDDFKTVIKSEEYAEGNIIFEIDYPFDLDGENVTMPENCTLRFNGGTISNSGEENVTITGNKTAIEADATKILSMNIDLVGSWTIDNIFAEWFGAIAYRSTSIEDPIYSSDAINRAIVVGRTIQVPIQLLSGYYFCDKTIELYSEYNLPNEDEITGDVTIGYFGDKERYTNKYPFKSRWGSLNRNRCPVLRGQGHYKTVIFSSASIGIHIKGTYIILENLNVRCTTNYYNNAESVIGADPTSADYITLNRLLKCFTYTGHNSILFNKELCEDLCSFYDEYVAEHPSAEEDSAVISEALSDYLYERIIGPSENQNLFTPATCQLMHMVSYFIGHHYRKYRTRKSGGITYTIPNAVEHSHTYEDEEDKYPFVISFLEFKKWAMQILKMPIGVMYGEYYPPTYYRSSANNDYFSNKANEIALTRSTLRNVSVEHFFIGFFDDFAWCNTYDSLSTKYTVIGLLTSSATTDAKYKNAVIEFCQHGIVNLARTLWITDSVIESAGVDQEPINYEAYGILSLGSNINASGLYLEAIGNASQNVGAGIRNSRTRYYEYGGSGGIDGDTFQLVPITRIIGLRSSNNNASKFISKNCNVFKLRSVTLSRANIKLDVTPLNKYSVIDIEEPEIKETIIDDFTKNIFPIVEFNGFGDSGDTIGTSLTFVRVVQKYIKFDPVRKYFFTATGDDNDIYRSFSEDYALLKHKDGLTTSIPKSPIPRNDRLYRDISDENKTIYVYSDLTETLEKCLVIDYFINYLYYNKSARNYKYLALVASVSSGDASNHPAPCIAMYGKGVSGVNERALNGDDSEVTDGKYFNPDYNDAETKKLRTDRVFYVKDIDAFFQYYDNILYICFDYSNGIIFKPATLTLTDRFSVGSQIKSTMIGCTFVINKDVNIAANLTLPSNTTLKFIGGMINNSSSSARTITGNNTSIEAPLKQIFGSDITIEGTWKLKQVYKEWFGGTLPSNILSIINDGCLYYDDVQHKYVMSYNGDWIDLTGPAQQSAQEPTT